MKDIERSGLNAVISNRRSTRAFLSDPVPRNQIEDLLKRARMAPSGANLQPGSFHILTGQPLADLSTVLMEAEAAGRPIVEEYSYFPKPLPKHLKARQIAAGFALYGSVGIGRRDVEARRALFTRNYRFFDAPVGIVISIRRDMGKGCFMDLGMALQNFFLAATDAGLGVCGIGALANYGDLVARHLGLDESELVVCGMALGWPDVAHPVNGFATSRIDIAEFSSFRGFDADESDPPVT